ncbi:hypothetical protein AB0I28_01150 [Phytomonospora sp. NPDC050363]|uniref:hypothetical protein n=1 Tax=Phytomonospora sp. NPDC050363 TaxID=3155642 RepID=UPI0033FBA3DF
MQAPPGGASRRPLARLGAHAGVFLDAQALSVLLGLSWLWDLLSGRRGLAEALTGPPRALDGFEECAGHGVGDRADRGGGVDGMALGP